MATGVINFKKVNKSFDTDEGVNHVLKDIDLSIPKGKIFGVIGYSGAGKSTLIRCINGLEKPTDGTVTFNDQIVNQLDHKSLLNLRGKISMIFQQFNLMPGRTIAENISLPIKYQGFSKEEVSSKVRKLLDLVGLPDKYSAYPSSLSGGQKQRIAIARALINDPEVLLCDEATSALDPETTDSILTLLKQLNKDYGITIIIVTHEMHVIESICDDIAVLDKGSIVEQGNVYAVFSDPKEELTKKFINTTSNLKISQELVDTINLRPGQKLIRLSYRDGETVTPLISDISRQFNVNANIIIGDIKLIQKQLLGGLIIVLDGDKAAVDSAEQYLQQQKDVEVEVINHAR
ncbi:methionine ABC transporter ATP-binding protein [Lactobacillus sp. Sy-1]|uniref:methionine ABC transporter ATP-binding protein n=1 Tax=Lactobacillus sp. Sy-1 TaxID=2109645 RepID=UPI001C585E02|nr:ATP-binding cassette domain-containing protein [Lactobacillus sp. Sy-1]MBW1605057.1 ATP-binding cassette domain-containing protein [Lactobacillus sp. Sy-1]